MMLLGWESNTSIWQKSAKLKGGNLSLGVGNSRFPPQPSVGNTDWGGNVYTTESAKPEQETSYMYKQQ